MTAIMLLTGFVAGCLVGYLFCAIRDSDIMQADTDELVALRQTVREMGERIAELEEDGADWSWTLEDNEALLRPIATTDNSL